MGMSLNAIEQTCKSPVLCVVLNNRGLGAIRYEQEICGWPEFESGFKSMDFAKFADSHGWAGHKVSTQRELHDALDDFIHHPRPLLLDVWCTKDEPPMPALRPSLVGVASAILAWSKQGKRGYVSAKTAVQGLVSSMRGK